MSISGQNVTINYSGDGATKNFAYPNYLYELDDLVVQVTDAAGAVTTKVLGTDYNISDVADSRLGTWPNGVTIAFIVAPAAATTVTLSRVTDRTQTTTFVDNDPFPAATLEDSVDKLTAVMQELFGNFLGVLAGPPGSGVAGQWFIVTPFQAGGPFGMACTVSGTPGTWVTFGVLSL